jgi:hypothetical protein
MRTRVCRLLLAGVAIVSLAALSACSSPSNQVEKEIAKYVKANFKIVGSTVTCPKDAKSSKGAEFDCTVTIEGQRLNAHVVFTKDKRFEATPDGRAFPKQDLEDVMAPLAEEQAGEPVRLDCPGTTYTVIVDRDTVECTATGPSRKQGTATIGLDAAGQPKLVDFVKG